jgi:hypothetical protein
MRAAGPPIGDFRRPVASSAVGALKPWHIAGLCCLVASSALLAGLVSPIVPQTTKR